MAGDYNIAIHTFVHPSQLSTYSSLEGALTPVTATSQFLSPTRKRVPQIACKGISDPLFFPIGFDYLSQARQGVALRDFSIRSQSALTQLVSGVNEHILAGLSIRKIDLRIRWFGYEHIDDSFIIPISTTTTKGQLGSLIAKQFRKFCDKAASSVTGAPCWRIGPGAITFDQLYLVALYSFGAGICQADIAVDSEPVHS